MKSSDHGAIITLTTAATRILAEQRKNDQARQSIRAPNLIMCRFVSLYEIGVGATTTPLATVVGRS
jgi:hypothetical protein